MEDPEKLRAILSPEELERMDRYVCQADRDRYLVAWSLVRRVMGEITDSDPRHPSFVRTCTLCGHPSHGKPRLPGSGIDFSLSHSGDRILLGVSSDGEVGVDVEQTGRSIDHLARLVLHPDEPHVVGLDLLRVWVRKEAGLKATGRGLVFPMNQFTMADPPSDAILHDIPADAGYVAATAEIPAATDASS